jgi:hypothetical protein
MIEQTGFQKMRGRVLIAFISLTAAAAALSFLVSYSSIEDNSIQLTILAPKLTEAQQEENDVQALESKYLAKERASDKVELKAFKTVQRLSKVMRHKRPLWGRRKWPSYYANVFTSKDAFTADEPKHPILDLDRGDDDGPIDSALKATDVRRVRGTRPSAKRAEHARAHYTVSAGAARTQALYEEEQVLPTSLFVFKTVLIPLFTARCLCFRFSGCGYRGRSSSSCCGGVTCIASSCSDCVQRGGAGEPRTEPNHQGRGVTFAIRSFVHIRASYDSGYRLPRGGRQMHVILDETLLL